MAGSTPPSLSEGGVDIFLERLQSYFLVQKVKPEAQVHVLLLGLSERQYSLVRDHATPQLPADMKYSEVVEILKQHFKSTYNRMTERAKFREVKRMADESVSDFVARLKSASRYCDFGTSLNVNLVEQFRIGIKDGVIGDKLMDMPESQQEDMDKIVERAQGVELNRKFNDLSTSTSAQAVQAVGASRHYNKQRPYQKQSTKVTFRNNAQPAAQRPSPAQRCFRCNRPGHVANDRACPAKNKNCNICGRIGHFAKSKFCKRKQVGNIDLDTTDSNCDQPPVEDDTAASDDNSKMLSNTRR